MPATDSPLQTSTREDQAIARNEDLRRIVGQAYGSVVGRQLAESFYAVTYEELADAQIERIEGKGTDLRPCELERIDKLETDLLAAVAQIRGIAPESFLLRDPDRDVNTAAT